MLVKGWNRGTCDHDRVRGADAGGRFVHSMQKRDRNMSAVSGLELPDSE